MCEPATIAAVTTWLGTTVGGTAAAGAAAGAATAGAATAGTAALTYGQLLTLGLSAAGTGVAAVGAYQQSQTAKQVAANNAITAENQAKDAERRGELAAQDAQRQGAALASKQRSMFAARGLDLSSGTTGDILDQTAFFTDMDAQTARDNAAKEAWARRSQSANFSAEAAAQRPWLSASSTMLSGAGNVADRWYSYGRRV